jgi:hypothetical protein
MSGSKAYQKRQAKARQRRYLTAQKRLERDRRQAQQAAKVLEQALHDLGLPERSYWIPGSYVTSNSMSAGSNALPRLRTLCTNSKNPRSTGSFS